ncbi:MAG: hypothetical protein AAF828_11635, partial [Bacteroidota bacterium]
MSDDRKAAPGRINPQAVLYMVVAAASFAIMNLIVKYLDGYSALEIVFFRSGTTLLLCIGYLRWRGISWLGNEPRWLIARGVTGTISMALFFYSIKFHQIAQMEKSRALADTG